MPQLVVGADDELGRLGGEVGGVALPAGQSPGLGLQRAVDRLGGSRELDVAVAFDRGVTVYGTLGFGDLFVDTTPGLARPVMSVLIVDHPVRNPADLLRRGGWPGLSQHQPSEIASFGCSSRH